MADWTETDGTERPLGAIEPGARQQSYLTLDEKECARRLLREWDESHRHVRRHLEQWKANRAHEKGYTGVMLVKKQDSLQCWIPKGATPNGLQMNKAARLCRRVRSVLFADPPLPDALPASGDDDDVNAAEFSTRVLTDICGPSQLNYPVLTGDAFDLGSTHGSGFIRFWVDQQGGGTRNGQWQPALKYELLTGRQVRFVPAHTRDLWTAEGVMIGALVPYAHLKGIFPDLAELPPEELARMADVRPAGAGDQLLPIGVRDTRLVDGAVADDTLFFVLTRYHRQCALYPKGFYAVALGDDFLAHRGPWYDEAHDEPLDVPLTQMKQLHEEGNPYGASLMEHLAPGNEQRAQMLDTMQVHLDRFKHRKTFVPLNSNLNPEQLQSETRTVIPVIPGGEPRNEDVPDFPQAVEKMAAQTSLEMDDESGLQQAGQALNTDSVRSGEQAKIILDQVTTGLSDLRQNSERGIVRGYQVILQQVRWQFTAEQTLRFVGADGAWQQRAWSNADLGSTRDVALARGSFTQLSRPAKADLVAVWQQAGYLGPEDAKSVVASQVGALIGVQEDPHRLRVRGQIDRWKQGPPEGWMPPAPVSDPNTGQVTMPPDPVATAIFAPRASDEEPDVALVRTYELGRALSGERFAQLPQAWQMALDAEYRRMRAAAGIQTIAEQQQAQQQQAEAQQQAAAQQQQSQQQEAQMKQQESADKMQLEQQKLALETKKVDYELLAAEQARHLAQAEKANERAREQASAVIQYVPQKPAPSELEVVRDEMGRITGARVKYAGAPQ